MTGGSVSSTHFPRARPTELKSSPIATELQWVCVRSKVDRLTQRFTSMLYSDNYHIPGRVGCTTFCFVASDTFRNRQTSRVTVHGLYAVVAGLPCVFCIVSQICDFVKNFFRFVAGGTFSIQSDEVRTGHSTGHFAPVAVQPFLTVWTL